MRLWIATICILWCTTGSYGWAPAFRRKFAGALLSGSIGFIGLGASSWATTFSATDSSGISFTYPDNGLGLVNSPKLVKTHTNEIFFKSETIKGLSVGVTVDPVKITNIKEFASPEGLADRVVKVEKSKEGVFEANVVSAKESANPVSLADPSVPAYEVEYNIDSSRGQNHYFVKATVINSKLYVFTVQCKEGSFNSLNEVANEILGSFTVADAATASK